MSYQSIQEDRQRLADKTRKNGNGHARKGTMKPHKAERHELHQKLHQVLRDNTVDLEELEDLLS